MGPSLRLAFARRGAAALLGLLLLAAGAAPAQASTGLPADWQRGANVTSWWYDEWESAGTDASLAALRDTGATDAAFVATWYMPNGSASSVAPDRYKTPSDAGLLRAMRVARGLGLRVVLKPHVDVFDGTFRGSISPADPNAWFASYSIMLDHYADLARQAGASMLVVGTELTSMSGYTAQWRQLIADARSRFGGTLTFAANHISGAQHVAFWDALDLIGIDAYMPLSSGDPDPSVDALTSAWSSLGYVDAMAALHRQYDKPLVFTEIGYQSRTGTAITPWETTGPISQGAQQRAYEAAYRVWSAVPWFKGMYWWDWRPGGFDASDGDFSPRGKLAEATMRDWNTAPFAPPAPATPAPSPAPLPPQTAPPARTVVVELHGRVHRRARRVRLAGRIRPGCAAAVSIELVRDGRRRVHRVLRSQSDARGAFAASSRLRPGRWRAVARVAGGCGAARSKLVRLSG